MSSRGSSEDPSKVELLKDALYQAVVDSGSDSRLWNQKELLDLDVIPGQNLVLLMKAVQGLCQDFLFKAMNDGRFGLCWRWRSAEDAQKYRSLNQDQIMVYELIDDAGADGIWARTLKLRLNMHESVLKQCLKNLEGRGYIRDMKSVENIGKKMYIKATLRPSDRATGGPWYTDAMLDENFIGDLQNIVFETIRSLSTYIGRGPKTSSANAGAGTGGASTSSTATPRQPKKGIIRGSVNGLATGSTSSNNAAAAGDLPGRGRKRGLDGATLPSSSSADTADHPKPHHHHHHRRRVVRLPMPAGYTQYPTVRRIAELIEQGGVTNNTTLGEADIQQLVDVLVYDGLLEPVKLPGSHETGYRALNAARLPVSSSLDGGDEESGTAGATAAAAAAGGATLMGAEPLNNGFTESPCGLCPVFDLCEDGGPVSPANCVYFNRWLGVEEASTEAGVTLVGDEDGDP